MYKNYKGLLISFEGVDGSGKSTLSKKIYERLINSGHQSVLTKEPGGTVFGKHLREILNYTGQISMESEFLLFAADRAHHFRSLIIPALQSGNIVISDRLADSSLAYQGFGRGLDLSIIQTVNAWAMADLQPNLSIYLRLDYESAMKRILGRNEKLTRFEKESQDFYQRIINGFDEIFKVKNNALILDASDTLDNLENKIFESLNEKFNLSSAALDRAKSLTGN